MIALIDYGRGNLASVANALKRLRADYRIVSRARELPGCQAVILPGVGAFDDAARALRQSGLNSALRTFVGEGRPLLGICLGLQLLFERSAEGEESGLGLIAGEVRAFETHTALRGLKIPHMGWNSLTDCHDPLFTDGDEVYFVHSYYAAPLDESVVSARCHYGFAFPAAVRQGALRATQFHPEKSGQVGLDILQRFLQELNESSMP